MTELLTAQTVYRIGRKRTQHGWSVHIVGDDATGYSVEVRTRCGIVLTGCDEASQVEQGFVTCGGCTP